MSTTPRTHEERADAPIPTRTITLRVNGAEHRVPVEDRRLLVEVIREHLGLKGTHVGCYSGDCGACTLVVDGKIVKSCLILAASVDGAGVRTVEGLADRGELDPVQQAFWDQDAFQCGFCMPGFLFAAHDLLATHPDPSEKQIREAIDGNLCRCAGYQNIVAAVKQASTVLRADGA